MRRARAPLPRWADIALIPLANVVLALLAAGMIVLAIGENPLSAVRVMLAGALGDSEGVGYTLYYATNFILTGLAVAVAFHAGLFNIGGEGQAALGGLGVGLVLLAGDRYLPFAALLPLALLAGLSFGAAWALMPAWLQAYRGSHIVITTIMFNFLAAALMVYLMVNVLIAPGSMSPESREFGPAAQLPQMHQILAPLGVNLTATPLNLSVVVAALLCVCVWLLLWHTPFGFELRIAGQSATAAIYAGVRPRRIVVVAMCLSGAIAGCVGLFSERSGIIDIGLEGKMLASAFAAATIAALCNSAWIALAAGIAVAGGFALLHGYACITQRGNQVVSGLALNILAAGLTIVLGNAWFHRGGQTPSLSARARFMPIDLPGAAAVHDVPVLGAFYGELIGGHNLIVYAALAAVPLTHWVVGRTRFGLRLRAVGENPQAVDTAGISVAWLRYRAVLLCGLLTGIAGTYLAIAQNAGFSRDMTAGQGYIALAALIFGKWRAYGALGACLMFGLLDAIAIRLQGVHVAGVGEVPVQLVQAMPYLLTVILLAGFIGKAVAPKAAGVPYVKEQ